MNSITPSVAATAYSLEDLRKKQVQHAIDRTIGAKVRGRRTELGLTQMNLAEALGITFQQIQKYENGGNRIAAPRLYQLAQVLKVSPDWFFEHLADPQPQELRPSRACIETARMMQTVAPETQREILGIVRRIVNSLPKAAA